MPRRVSRATSFEIDFSRTVLGGTGVPVLRPSPRVGGCYIHPLFGTVYVNDMTRAWEGQCLDRTQMDGCYSKLERKERPFSDHALSIPCHSSPSS